MKIEAAFQVIWRTVLVFLLIFISWQISQNLTPSLAQSSLKNGVGIFRELEDKQKFTDWLNQTSWFGMKARDRSAIASFYDGGILARDEAKKRVEKSGIKLGLISAPFSNKNIYSSINEELFKANELLAKNNYFYQNLYLIFDYYEISTLAIFNFIYYDPNVAIKFYKEAPNYEILLQKFGVDYSGLQKTEERLSNLPDYQDDNLKEFALPLVKSLTIKAQKISDLAGQQKDQEAIELAEEFDLEVRDAQEKIIENRKSFWKSINKDLLINDFEKLTALNQEETIKLNNFLIELEVDSNRK